MDPELKEVSPRHIPWWINLVGVALLSGLWLRFIDVGLVDYAATSFGLAIGGIATLMAMARLLLYPDAYATNSDAFKAVAATIPAQLIFCALFSINPWTFFKGALTAAVGVAFATAVYKFVFPDGPLPVWKSLRAHHIIPLRAGVSILFARDEQGDHLEN